MSAIHDEHFPKFESLGESEVRKLSKCGDLHIMQQEPARVWLALKDAERDSRTERWARHAAYAAYAAAAIAAISIIITILIK
jgi:hypothetical protein